MKDLTFYLTSLGCPKNLIDSENLVNELIKHGFKLTNQKNKANLLILNTCAFIKPAIIETEEKIKDLVNQKQNNKIMIVGCYVARFMQHTLKAKFPWVDYWITPKEIPQIAQKIKKDFLLVENTQKLYTKLTPSNFAYLKISEGCRNYCSYCTIPHIRGNYKSFSLKKIIKKAQEYISFGVSELILVAEDTTSWGVDLYGKPQLEILLEELVKLKELKWIRILYMYPQYINPNLLNTIKKYENKIVYLDIPIQHCNEKILKNMNRHYSAKKLLSVIKNIKKLLPNTTLRTSVIVGFPGESEKEFDELKKFVQKGYFENLGCFMYSREHGTKAYDLPKQIPQNIKEKRRDIIMQAQQNLVFKQNQSLIGKTINIYYQGNQIARSAYHAPEIDAVIYITNHDEVKAENYYMAKILDFDGYDLIAKII